MMKRCLIKNWLRLKLLYTKWTEVCALCEKQKKMINTLTHEKEKGKACVFCEEQKELIQILVQEKKKLQDENVELQEEASMLETELESMNKSLRMLNNESKVLDEILEAEKKGKSMKGNGFDFKCTNQ